MGSGYLTWKEAQKYKGIIQPIYGPQNSLHGMGSITDMVSSPLGKLALIGLGIYLWKNYL